MPAKRPYGMDQDFYPWSPILTRRVTYLRRLDVIRFFAFSALLLTPSAISWAQQRPPIAEKMAKTHGLDSFGQVEGIRYTLNVARPDGNNVARNWEWNPKTDAVS
jgi:hypothetical protein